MGSLNMNMNMNMNMDMNMASPGASVGGGGTRVRFNTMDYRKYLQVNANNITDDIVPVPVLPTLMRFPAYWDADLQACQLINDFLCFQYPDWRVKLDTDVAGGVGFVPTDLTSPHKLTAALLRDQIIEMLDRAPDREDRFAEIIDQHNGEAAIGHFLGMLMIDPGRMPATHLLIRFARRLGEHLSMCLKYESRCPRPSQLCSALVPMIDPPATPSFPSGHSIQAQLFYRVLQAAAPPMRPLHLLDDLANRIGENRVIAGLHFPKDHLVGKKVADWCFNRLLTPVLNGTAPDTNFRKRFQKLVIEATGELANQSVSPLALPGE